ncbi:hypothetical protein, partial [Roseovarius gahaiensis]|uniref:hypothetical protein n=1 Tax=Roseovarius gahaiensis TaxID=2716691 RepID=UPI001E2BB364
LTTSSGSTWNYIPPSDASGVSRWSFTVWLVKNISRRRAACDANRGKHKDNWFHMLWMSYEVLSVRPISGKRPG